MKKFMLETRGYVVLTAKTDEQTANLLKHNHVDLILTCVPNVIREAKSMELTMPIVFLSGYAELGTAGADAVLTPESQSPVEMLAAVKVLLHHFKDRPSH